MQPIRVFLTLSIAVGMWASAPAAMAQYPLPVALVDLSTSTVDPDSLVFVSGSGWLPNSVVDLTLFSAPTPLGSANVDGDGEFGKLVKIPAGTALGQHFIRVQGTAANGQPDTVSAPLQVVGAGAGAGGEAETKADAQPLTLPFTGVVIRKWMLAGMALLLLGVLSLMVGRRRARAASYD
jgi:hypothetical protein